MSGKVARFEDLIAWRKAMELAVDVYRLTRDQPFVRDFALCAQIHRAAISVPSNIAEGFDRGTRSEFHRFLSIAKASCAEVRTQLQLALRLGYIEPAGARQILEQTEELSRIIGGLRNTVAVQRRTPPP
jgi:four helix bundle protein